MKSLRGIHHGVPRPKLVWYKYENDVKKALEFNNHEHMCLENDGKMLRLKFAKVEDEGTFECEAKYDEFSDQRSVTIKISMEFIFFRACENLVCLITSSLIPIQIRNGTKASTS